MINPMITKPLIVAAFAFVVLDVRAAIAEPCNTGQTAVANYGDRYVQENQRQEGDQPDVGEQAKIGGTTAVPLSLSPETHKDDLTTLPPEGQTPSKMADQSC